MTRLAQALQIRPVIRTALVLRESAAAFKVGDRAALGALQVQRLESLGRVDPRAPAPRGRDLRHPKDRTEPTIEAISAHRERLGNTCYFPRSGKTISPFGNVIA
jgi:hypothetical protein